MPTAAAASLPGPIGDTLDERVHWYVRDDLLRLVGNIPGLAHHELREMADQLALLEDDRDQLAGVWQLLSVLGGVAATITVTALLWSTSGWLVLLLAFALLVAMVQTRGAKRQRTLVASHEHLRRLGAALVARLTDPVSGVEVRCFGLVLPMLRTAAGVLGLRQRRLRGVTVRYTGLVVCAWMLYGPAYLAALAWPVIGVRDQTATVGDVTLLLLIGPQITSTAAAMTSNASSPAAPRRSADTHGCVATPACTTGEQARSPHQKRCATAFD